jgi:hypothetical protein
MKKQVRATLWVSMGSMRGQKSRPVLIGYHVNPMGSKTLYGVESITDARTDEEYDIEGTLSLNGDMDALIAAADPKMREFAKRELGVTLGAPTKKKPIKKPIIQSTETNDLLSGL